MVVQLWGGCRGVRDGGSAQRWTTRWTWFDRAGIWINFVAAATLVSQPRIRASLVELGPDSVEIGSNLAESESGPIPVEFGPTLSGNAGSTRAIAGRNSPHLAAEDGLGQSSATFDNQRHPALTPRRSLRPRLHCHAQLRRAIRRQRPRHPQGGPQRGAPRAPDVRRNAQHNRCLARVPRSSTACKAAQPSVGVDALVSRVGARPRPGCRGGVVSTRSGRRSTQVGQWPVYFQGEALPPPVQIKLFGFFGPPAVVQSARHGWVRASARARAHEQNTLGFKL